MTVVLKGGELELIGSASLLVIRELPLIRMPWLNEGPVLMGHNGRPRAACTMPGYGAGKKPMNYGRRYPPEPLTPDEVVRLLDQCGDTPTEIRNRALIVLLWRAGLRVSEALALRPHHVDFEARTVTVMRGKGGKRRIVGIDPAALMEIQRWMLERAMLGVKATAPLFCTVQRPGRGNTVHPAYVRDRLKQYGERAGIPKRIHPHGFRHTMTVELAREGVGMYLIQRQLGHSHLGTTAHYLAGIAPSEVVDVMAARKWPGGKP